tara:strand:- start:12282 stop:13949 length:1668 start_codon:yes stop_codon:yes gene_type:complete
MVTTVPGYKGLVDASGNPLMSDSRVGQLQAQLSSATRQVRNIKAKYDAAHTGVGNENHWANSDKLDPHNAASLKVRSVLRSRSRYEVIENNPFLKGIILTLANDFVGRSGPKLQITDKRLSPDRRKAIEERFATWSKSIKLRQKLWRMRVAKITDGETFLRAYTNYGGGKRQHPLRLDLQVLECDRVSSYTHLSSNMGNEKRAYNEIDGVRFDSYENPLAYHILNKHPGGSIMMDQHAGQGQWTPTESVIHWFRQDRGWLRGIPELTPSLPLCAILRRYTLAIIRHAETAADLTALIESEGPPGGNSWTDGAGGVTTDDPFDTFPIEMGSIVNLPWGYKVKQLNPVPFGVQYDEFVGSLLREIIRPIHVPYNMQVGTSKDSNMASAVVDRDIYRSGQESERSHCNEEVMDPTFELFWDEATLLRGYLGDDLLRSDNTWRHELPAHVWRWDRIGQDHTDPAKVANMIKTYSDMKVMTDRDIQEVYYNRDVEDWRDEVREDLAFQKELRESGLMPDVEDEVRVEDEKQKSVATHNPIPDPVAPAPTSSPKETNNAKP